MNYYALGLGVGILAGAVVFILTALFRQKSGKCAAGHYDERQLSIRRKAYQAGFFTLLLSLSFAAILDLMEICWCEAPLDKFFCIFLSVTVFACTAILKDAYFGLGEKKKVMILLFSAVTVIQFSAAFSSFQEGTLIVDGILTLKGISLGCGTIFLIILLTILVQHFRTAGASED